MTDSEAKVILESEYKFHGECSVFGEALEIAPNLYFSISFNNSLLLIKSLILHHSLIFPLKF